MKRFITYILLAAGLIVPVQSVFAQSDEKKLFNPVYTGVTSLSIAPDSRAGALGDVGCATDPYLDNNSQYWNPSKYPFTNSQAGVSLCYTPWLRKLVSDIDLANLTGFYKLDDYSALSASLTYFSLGDVYVIDGSGVGTSNIIIHPYEMAVDFDYSRKLSENFSAAVGMRFIYSDLQYNYEDDVFPGKAFSADISMYYNNYIGVGRRDCLLGLGLNASTLDELVGTKLRALYQRKKGRDLLDLQVALNSGKIDVDRVLDCYRRYIEFVADKQPTYKQFMNEVHPGEDDTDLTNISEYNQWLASTGYNEMSPIAGIFKSFSDAPGGFEEELREIYWGVGAEYNYNDQFFLRGGYHYENEYKGNRKYFTIGAGFRMNVFSLDAAYLVSTAQSNPLDQTLRFTLSFDMDGIKQIFGR